MKIPLFAVSLLLLCLPVVAQFKNIKLDEQHNGDYMCEPSIAINPKNPLNIVAASVLNNIYVTKDGGATWKKIEVVSSMGVYGDPSLIADGGGTFYFFHLSDPTGGKGGYDSEKLDRIVVQRSDDGGETWTDGTAIGLNHPKDQDKQWPAIDSKGNLTLTWTQFDTYGSKDRNCHSNILMSTSKNGSKWSEPIVMSQIPGNCVDNDSTVMGAMPAILFDGKMFVVWALNEKIFLDRSFDGNLWLSNDIAVQDQKGGWDLAIAGHDRCNGLPVLMTDRSKSGYRGNLYLLWADQKNGKDNTDVWFTKSNNYGDNWSTPLNVSVTRNNHQYLPWMTVDQTTGYIYIVYYDRSRYDDLKTDVVLAWSTDGGSSFRNATISETPFEPSPSSFFGDYTNIAAHKGVITPIWTRMDSGKTSVWTTVIRHDELEALNNKK
ncbi:MAG TPA: sialidase family protein [Chryseosolibacter sp.]